MPRARGWVWEHYETKVDARGRQMTACIYCDSSLAGRGNPIRMTRHLALYCLAVPRAVKAKAAHAVNKPPAAASINPSVGNQASSIVSDDIKMEDYADHGDDWASSDGSEDEGQQDKSRILAVLSPIQSEVHRSPHLAEKEQDGLLLSQYLAPTTDELLARALSRTNLSAQDMACPEWRDFFASVGYVLPSLQTMEQLIATLSSQMRYGGANE
ncbi:hypothetical protein AaE_014831 [Aphanomyces astaci]|uniref:Uncharacterized protein n=1 Tax=Aphanomyces astaci TaxID=112090 RepID=A0A6A4Z4H3_APHAT|nr:hypothetical protein AaE_014831 [Aphanomyces astaci]